MTPLRAAMRIPEPIVRCSAIATCPPIMTPSPNMVLPAMPTWAAMTQQRPMRTLWAIWTRLSITVPEAITVSPSAPRSGERHAYQGIVFNQRNCRTPRLHRFTAMSLVFYSIFQSVTPKDGVGCNQIAPIGT